MAAVKFTTSLFILLALVIIKTAAQFPAICVKNATLPDSTCCPTPPGFAEPCGGPTRGRCIRVQLMDDLRGVPEVSQRDDRFDWPTKFFKSICSCYGNFSGYMCHECWYGTTGPNCTERVRVVRKEVSRLTPNERDRFISLIEKSMTVQSDYMILNTSHSSDPTTQPQFLNATVFQFLSYLHYYVSRKTNFGDDLLCDDGENMWPDFAHGGPMFPIWHRLYSLKWEQALRKISGDENFALPYWDWINAGGTCKVCTDEWFGSRNYSDPTGTLSNGSVFRDTRIMCHPPENGCQVCDPYIDSGPIIRKPAGNPKYPNLPTREAVDFTMTLTTYDLDPFSVRSSNIAFRNVFEGYANADGPSITNSSMHNLIHSFLNGTMTQLATAAMDPIFLVHHTFVDKLFEIWRRKNKATARMLPVTGAQPGHNRNSYIVPFFPLKQAFDFFQDTENLGYTYDNLNIDDAMTPDKDSMFLSPSYIAVILEAGVILVLVIIIGILVRKPEKAEHEEINNDRDEIDEIYGDFNEKEPIVKHNTSSPKENYDTYQPIG